MLDVMLKNDVDVVASGYVRRNANQIICLRNLPDMTIDFKSDNASDIVKEWMGDFDGCRLNSTVFGKLYKAEVIKKSYENVPDDMQLGEDIVNYLNLIGLLQKIVCMSNVYYNYYNNTNSLTHAKSVFNFGKREYTFFIVENLSSKNMVLMKLLWTSGFWTKQKRG